MPNPGRSARDVRCPRCGAAPNRSCETDEGLPWADHAERLDAASALEGGDGERSGRRRRAVGYDSASDMPQVARERRLPRDYVRGFTCPKCGSGPREPCVDGGGQPRGPNHRERVAVARASLSKRSAKPDSVRLWVAGFCPDGPGPGGWGAVLWVEKRDLVRCGSAPLTTRSRMTLTAVIEGLGALPLKGTGITVHVDAGHVLTALSKGWPALWKEHDWIKDDGTPVKNRDLWERTAAVIEGHDIRWRSFVSSGRQQERVLGIAAAQR
jgi:ribonuclease HI